MHFSKIEVSVIFFKYFRGYFDEIQKRWPEIAHFLTLKPDLARCMCGMNMADGALKHRWVVLSNSEIKSGG